MKAKNLCICAGLCAGFAATATAGDKPNLQQLDNNILVQPVRIAKINVEKGAIVRTGEWMDYGANGRSAAQRVFDCFGDVDSDGVMDDSGGCGLSGSRWYFGTAYCNGMASNDMAEVESSSDYCRADFGWYWTCGGFGTEQCLVAIFTQESNPDACEANSFDNSGWLIDFGTLSCNPGGYYYTNVDLGTAGSWPAVTDGDGSYVMQFLTSSGSALATCAQPMLWGTGDGGGATDNKGSQATGQLDDDNPIDGSHDTISECYTYSFGVCPDPLGAMLQFWGEGGGTGTECDYADCNDDGVVDTRDFTCFLGQWASQNSAADCNGDGVVDTRDFTCFLGQWAACRG